MMQSEGVADYRQSHLSKGADYDVALAQHPFSRYKARNEAAIVERIVEGLFPAGIPRYLDFACGTGRIVAQLEGRAGEAYAVDVSERMVAVARQKCPNTRFLVLDITRERPDIEPVDLVTAFRFFANAQKELRDAVLAALSQMVRPGGYLLLNNHRNSWSIHSLLQRASGQPCAGRLGYLELRRMLARHHFRTVRTFGIGVWLFRAKLHRHELLNSRTATILEPISRLRPLGPFCPDTVVLCQRSP